MPRSTRLTSALAGRGKALAAAAAAAAVLAGAGTASAATLTSATPAAVKPGAVLAAVPHGPGAVLATPGATTLNPAAPARTEPATTATPAQHPGAAARPAAPAKAAKAVAAAKQARPARHRDARPYQIYDSVTPSAIPAHARVATYADGGYAVSPAQVAGHKHVLWIDTNGADPRANALDVEPGDATPAMAATWVSHKLHAAAGAVAIIYTMRSDWAATQAAVATLPAPMQSHVRWWIADPTGTPHIVPGADATQWYWGHNYDITTARPGF
jgi:hypothetical protein